MKELLSDAAVDYSAEGGVRQAVQRVARLLQSLPEAEVDQGPIRGFLKDLDVALAVSTSLTMR